MLIPGRGFTNSRLSDTEQRGERTLRIKDARHSRDAAARQPRQGRFFGITAGAVGRTTTGNVQLCFFNIATSKYRYARDADNAIATVAARCFKLNTDETIPADTAVDVEFFPDMAWQVTNAYCSVRDWELEDEETTGSPGDESPGSQPMVSSYGGDSETITSSGDAVQDFGSSGGQFAWPI